MGELSGEAGSRSGAQFEPVPWRWSDYGNQNRKGWNAAFSSYYDFKRGLVQFSTVEVTYNTDCCGISVEYRRFNIGPRDETQYRVAFAVSNVGTFGTLKKQERIF